MGDIDEEQLQEQYEAFRDESNDGLTQKQAYECLCNLNKNPSGLDFFEFKKDKKKQDTDLFTLEDIREMYKVLGNSEEKLRKAFKLFDDGDGFVSKDELRELLRVTDVYEGGLYKCDEDMEWYYNDTLKLADKNGDGKISIDELCALLNEGGVTL